MFDYSKETLSNKECVDVLFKEYDTLRGEIIARTSGGYQLISIVALLSSALLAWAGSHPASVMLWIGLLIIVGASILFFAWAHRDNNMLGRRIAEIEKEINDLLGGRELLKWESHYGAAVTGWLRRKPYR